MKIELKNIQHYPRMSEATQAFVADIFIDGQKVGIAKNDGHGENTRYEGYNAKCYEILARADAFCKTLAPAKFDVSGKPLTIKMNLENFIDHILYEYLDKKEQIKFERAKKISMKDRLVIDISEKEYASFKLSKPVAELLPFIKGEEYLKSVIAKHIVPKLEAGQRVINDNIPEKIFRDAGLKDAQFIPNRLKTLSEKLPDKPVKTKKQRR